MFARTENFPKGLGMNTIQPPSIIKAQNRILILSEEPDLAYALGKEIRRLGVHVELKSVTNMDKKPPKSLPYDGIILDLDTKESSRLHIFHNLYTLNPHVPIVVIGSENMHYEFLFAFIGGAREFLVKPVDSLRLKQICLRFFL
jgi:DNA-binding NtrC family response regulator